MKMAERRGRIALSSFFFLVSLRLPAGLAVRDQPLQRDVDVVLLLARDGVATDLTVLNSVEVHFLYESVFVQGTR